MAKLNNKAGNKEKDSGRKLELAKQITRQRKRMENTYNRFETAVLRVFRWVSSWFDRVLFNPKYGKIVALVLACFLYSMINLTDRESNTTSMSMSQQIENIPISINYNSENYEIEVDYTTVKAQISGAAADILSVVSAKNYSVSADLTGLTEGTHTVTLTKNFSNRVTAYVEPSRISVTIKRKSTQQFDVTYDYINQDKMDDIYILDEPVFDATRVSIRTTREKLESIAMVKALIDVSGVTENFEQDAILVAYDQSGNKVDCDIIPQVIKASVNVSSPNKNVPVAFELNGAMPEGKAISEVAADQEVVKIYGTDAVLSRIDSVACVIDTQSLTAESSRQVCQLTIPSGVKSPSVTKVNMEIKVVDAQSRTIEGVNLRYVNNYKGYAVNMDDSTIAVQVFGSLENISRISANDIYVYMDMANAELGENQQLPIYVQQDNYLVRYILPSDTVTVDVLSGSNTDSPENYTEE